MIIPDLEPLARDLAELHSDPRNARKHNERSITAVMASLVEFGQVKPIVALYDGKVIAGNGTLEAARRLGWTRIAVARFEDEAKAKAYAIADNRTSELSEWDADVLSESLLELRDDAFALESVGFSDLELERMLAIADPAIGAGIDANAEWNQGGMPEFEQPDKTAHRQLIVSFKTEEDAQAFGVLIGQPLTDKTRSVWHPKAEIDHLMDKRYAADDPKKKDSE